MKRLPCILLGVALPGAVISCAAAAPVVAAQHVIVYQEPGHFGGWPANSGMWSWGDEILVCFTRAVFQEKADSHSIDRSQPGELRFARSLDGGVTWTIENPSLREGEEPAASPGGIPFAHPDFALRVRNGAFHYTVDRGRTWQGPFALPDFGVGELTARTDYLVQGPSDCLLFLSSKFPRVQVDDEDLQDRAFCARTRDGGKTFEFVGWMTGEPLDVRSVMPATVRADDGRLVSVLRRRYDLPTGYRNDLNWLDAYVSADDGKTWNFLQRIAHTDVSLHNGNPPSLAKLPDGTLVAAWGVRSPPYGIRARVSRDHGRTWGPELILREDGRKYDIGYCRSAARSDGRVVTVYYYTTKQRPENHIAATIWAPPARQSNPAPSAIP